MASAPLLYLIIAVSCGGGSGRTGNVDFCQCSPSEPTSADYRHDAKHVPLPGTTPQEIDVNTILSWPVPPAPAGDAPRTGRELQLFHIAQAYLQAASIKQNDCDIHFEISQTADRTAHRVIVETPIDAEYCSARRATGQTLAAHGFTLGTGSGDLAQPLTVDVLGLAFQDNEHKRGSVFVSTTWELHPAVVTITQ
jgi:hypothetical protein